MAVRVFALFAIALLFSASALDDHVAEKAKPVRERCAKESGVNIGVLDAINGGATLSPDPEIKAYIKCFMEAAGMLVNGAVDMDVVLSLLPADFKSKYEAELRKCGTVKGADDAETAFNTQQCWQNNIKEFFLP